MKQGKYESLREQYPEYISLDQLYRICGIAKRSARYLIDHGIIPYQDTGKKTWRYRIALDDVITYLRRREQVGSMIPCGAVTSRKNQKTRKVCTRKSFAQLVVAGQESQVADYFHYIYAEYDDVLTAQDISEMTGLGISTVIRLLRTGAIKSLMSRPMYRIPKPFLLEFVVTPRFIEYRTNSEQFKKIIGGGLRYGKRQNHNHYQPKGWHRQDHHRL